MENTIKFSDLGISEEILRAVEEMGYTQPSPIQLQAIPFVLQGRDVIGQAQTGTGKTAAFAIPIIDLVDPDFIKPQAIILCPTRELAVQVEGEIQKLAKYHKKISSVAIYGGESIDKQIRVLKKGVQIVVGTPGRVQDHINRGTLKLQDAGIIVLDEADEMLDMGFRDDIEAIIQEMPAERQTVFFSATMAKPILDLTRKYQKDPEIIKVAKNELTVSKIDQVFYEVKQSLKMELMVRLMNLNNYALSVVFCNTKRMTDEVTESLGARGILAEALHGDLSQAQRDKVMGKFRKGLCTVLVATDVAARGIDVDNVEAVFNFDIPLDEEYYVHRIGRTGRAGKSGTAITFITGRREMMKLRDLERYTKASINKMTPPSVAELVELKKTQLIKDVYRVLSKEEDTQLFEATIEQMLSEGLTQEQISLGLLKMVMGDTVKEMKDQDFGIEAPAYGDRRREGGRESRFGDRREGGRGERYGDRREGGRSGERFDRGSRFGDRKEGGSRFGDSGSRFGDRKEGGRDFAPRTERTRDANMTRLFLNLGKRDFIRPNDIVGAIAGEAGLPGKSIGGIDIFDNFSFVDVPHKDAEHVVRVMKNNTIKGRTVNMEISKA
ncbi:MAG: DEAD/DEAH box helicase [Algoriphagus sp.]|uniref:DEAD/DEAH box helicase n=2 Tax=Algoriphagus sp. TaxID=1872435 RepID=UPI0027522AF0|nr:DEAD/DEAH box helicase [Algoriphagus sp.]MDP4838906.1 DEAD/DEAH box helicase [Algoriphagus sp.]MDP4904232.1 DEAD/DEAH box helicase [Algoriphagus sp.]MDP4958170.1 DEAD/DEAH box helicase [Algoriphagus sp.]MDP5124634.1 DEAD/DEAH box helicase [Algoriphagus sp.]